VNRDDEPVSRSIRMPDAELIVVPLRNSRAGLPGERVVIPSGTPVVPRIVVGIGLEVTGVEHAVAVDVSIVVMVALSEGAGCKGDCD
jgi:hypothetical protein